MSPNESVRILEALNVLCNVSGEVLQSHKTELLAAVQKLQTLIEERGDPVPHMTGDPGRVSPSLASHDSSSILLDTNESSSSSPNGRDLPAPSLTHRVCSPHSPQEHELNPVLSKSIEDLIQALNKESRQIKEYLSRSEQEATGKGPAWMTEDPRVVDLQMDGSHSSPEIKFRKGLSQRSLAIEFSRWENNTYGKSRVSERTQNPSILQKRRGGHIQEYLNNNQHRFNSQSATRAGIEHGIKLLVCEELLGRKAVSAILIFKYRRFRTIKFDELDDLKEAIKSSEWIFELAEQKAGWFDGCQNHYDAWYNGFFSRKRRRLNLASSEHEQSNPEYSHEGAQDAGQLYRLSNIDAAGAKAASDLESRQLGGFDSHEASLNSFREASSARAEPHVEDFQRDKYTSSGPRIGLPSGISNSSVANIGGHDLSSGSRLRNMKDLEVSMLRASDPNIQARLPQPPDYSVSEPMGPQPPNVQDAILPRPGHLTMDAVSGEEVDISIVQEHDQATREVATGWRLRNSRDAETSNSVLPAQSSSTQILYEKNLAPRCGNTGPENDIDLWSLPPLHNCDWTDLDLWDLDLWSIPLPSSMPSPRILPQYDKTIQTGGYRDPTTEFATPTDG